MSGAKILVPVFAVILAGSLIMGATSVQAADFWTSIIDGINEWFRISPFSGMMDEPQKDVSYISVNFYPETYEIKPAGTFSISSDDFHVEGFPGTIGLDFASHETVFDHEGSDMKIRSATQNTVTVSDLNIGAFSMDNIKLEITNGNWTETTVNGSAEFRDFSGMAVIYEDHVWLSGNVSKIIKK